MGEIGGVARGGKGAAPSGLRVNKECLCHPNSACFAGHGGHGDLFLFPMTVGGGRGGVGKKQIPRYARDDNRGKRAGGWAGVFDGGMGVGTERLRSFAMLRMTTRKAPERRFGTKEQGRSF